MKELSDAILTSLNNKLANGEMEKLVDAHVTNFLKKTVEDSLSSWGDVSKALKEKISKETISCLDRFDLIQYNTIISRLIKDRIGDIYVAEGEKHMNKLLDKIFNKPKDKYRLSELVKMIKDEDRYEDEMSNHIDDHGSLVFAYLDAEPDKKDYDCEYRIVYDKDMKQIISATKKDWRSERGRKKIEPKPIDNLTGIELTFFQIISYGIEVEWDEDSCSFSYERD